LVIVKGPRGELSQHMNSDITINVSENTINVSRPSNSRQHRALHGLTRSLIANMVKGVTEGFQKTLDLVGIGYRVQQSGQDIVLQVGFSHLINIKPLAGVNLEVEGNNRIHVKGNDKQAVGQLAAKIRLVRRPNAYTGKGIRYSDEKVRLKPGKSASRAS
jgi:large subunit ribosomal protein L6